MMTWAYGKVEKPGGEQRAGGWGKGKEFCTGQTQTRCRSWVLRDEHLNEGSPEAHVLSHLPMGTPRGDYVKNADSWSLGSDLGSMPLGWVLESMLLDLLNPFCEVLGKGCRWPQPRAGQVPRG